MCIGRFAAAILRSRSGRLNAINGQDRRCNRIGVPSSSQWRSAIRGCSCSIGFHERGLMLSPGGRVSYVFILPSIPVIPHYGNDSRLKFHRSGNITPPIRPPIILPFILVTVYDRVEFMYETPSFIVYENARDSCRKV